MLVQGSHYGGYWSLGEGHGTGYLGKNLDECMQNILALAKEAKIASAKIRCDPNIGDKRLPRDDLELLVLCLNDNTDKIKFTLADVWW